MLLVEMSSCTRKMYGGGEREQIRKQLRAKEMILAKLKNTPGVTNNQIRAATKNVANYKQQYQNKVNLYPRKNLLHLY